MSPLAGVNAGAMSGNSATAAGIAGIANLFRHALRGLTTSVTIPEIAIPGWNSNISSTTRNTATSRGRQLSASTTSKREIKVGSKIQNHMTRRKKGITVMIREMMIAGGATGINQ
jgi:hypothetical protein